MHEVKLNLLYNDITPISFNRHDAMNIEIIEKRIQTQKETYPVLLYMKGLPEAPRCGFSAQVVKILKELKCDFHGVDIVEDLEIRQVLPQIPPKWPTFPQLYVKGELIGGCDIITHLYEHSRAELIKMITV